jgi:hypothetical protein
MFDVGAEYLLAVIFLNILLVMQKIRNVNYRYGFLSIYAIELKMVPGHCCTQGSETLYHLPFLWLQHNSDDTIYRTFRSTRPQV